MSGHNILLQGYLFLMIWYSKEIPIVFKQIFIKSNVRYLVCSLIKSLNKYDFILRIFIKFRFCDFFTKFVIFSCFKDITAFSNQNFKNGGKG